MIRRLAPLVLLLFAATSQAQAQTRDPAAAQAMFDEAREAMKRKEYAPACAKFAESQRLDPMPGTLANLAVCEDKSGTIASAWTHAREAIEQLGPGDDRVPALRAIVARVEKRLPRLVIRLATDAPKASRVRRDGVELGDASLGVPLPVDPGEHTIVVVAPGRKDSSQTVIVVEGKTSEIQAGAGEPADPAPVARNAAPGTEPRPEPAVAGGGAGRRTLGYVVGGAGVIGLAVGTVTGVVLLGKKSTVTDAKDGCDQSARTCNTAGSLDAAHSGTGLLPFYYGGLAVGVLGLGAATYLLLTGDDGGAQAKLSVTPGCATMSGRF